MRISTFEYTDHAVEWVLEHIEFNALTLLVGASGVGKTRILKALLNLKKIANGSSLNGLQWKVKFSINNNSYEWIGKFENKGLLGESMFSGDKKTDKDKPSIEIEKLYINEDSIIDRNEDGIFFNGVKTVKLSQKESVISLLKEEDQIKDIHSEFLKILFDDGSKNEHEVLSIIFNEEKDSNHSKYSDLDSIRNSDEILKRKLYLTFLNIPEKFEDIKNSFIDVFPYVENLKIEPLENSRKNISKIFEEIPFIQIKEHGIKNWIDERKLSSGMYRTLMHIAELYLCADGTIILIDEFENSLGINCIDEITRSIVTEKRDLQFIITSHHPYIINNINLNNWKIITRKAGVIKNHNASQLNIGKSKHEAFTQLINLDEYSDGIEL